MILLILNFRSTKIVYIPTLAHVEGLLVALAVLQGSLDELK